MITKSYVGILLSGTLATGYFYTSGLSGGIILGKPFTGRPVRFTGYYKYVHNQGDSCAIYANLTKRLGSSRELVGRAKLLNVTDSITTYTKFNLFFDYFSADTPDSISVVFASSAGGATYVGHVGSTLYIDNIDLSYDNGINEYWQNSLKVQCYPVPAKNSVNFKLEKEVKDGIIEIYTAAGNYLMSVNVTGKEIAVPIDGLAGGKYFYKLISKSLTLNTGQFILE